MSICGCANMVNEKDDEIPHLRFDGGSVGDMAWTGYNIMM